MNTCSIETKKGKPCGRKSGEKKYCTFHEYLEGYTDEMLKNLTFCSGCDNPKYLPNGKTCDICKERAKANREKDKENIIKCKYKNEKDEECTFKQEPKLNNGFCGKHQVYFWKEDKEKDGESKVCVNFIRGCRNIFKKDEEFSRCLDCRMKDRLKDKERHTMSKVKRENNNVLVMGKQERSLEDTIICACSNTKLSITKFLEDVNDIKSKLFSTCNKCREKDSLRDSKQERKEYKQELEKTPKVKLSRYKKGARVRDLDFELEKEEFEKFIVEKCHYCGEKDEIILNGIDRINSNIGYKMDNCVSCCSMCNYLKRSLSKEDFLNKIKHIISNLGYGNFNYPALFKNHQSSSFAKYKKCAKDRSINFNINELMFNEIISMNCYLCNKKTDELHKNGVDRIDSLKDYDINNILSCCGDCNIMKSDFPLEKLLLKFILINNHNLNQDTFFLADKDGVKNQIIKNINTQRNNISSKLSNMKENKDICFIHDNEHEKITRIKNQYKRARQRGDLEEYDRLYQKYKDIRNKLNK